MKRGPVLRLTKDFAILSRVLEKSMVKELEAERERKLCNLEFWTRFTRNRIVMIAANLALRCSM